MKSLTEAWNKTLASLNNWLAPQKYMQINLKIMMLALLALTIYFIGFGLKPELVALDESAKLFFSLMIAYLLSTTNVFVRVYGYIRKVIH